jgi:hypothetical protein
VSFPLLLRYRLDLSLFTPQGFRFYLPAFLIAMLTARDGRDLAFFLYRALIPPDSGDEAEIERFKARLAVFTAAQQDIVDQFIIPFEEREMPYFEGDEALVDETYRAFANVEYPGDENIVENFPMNTFSYVESMEIEETLRGTHWKELPTSVLHYCSPFFLFSPPGFHYYFPAFLIALLANRDASDLGGFLENNFVPPDPDDTDHYERRLQRFIAIVDEFTPEQL